RDPIDHIKALMETAKVTEDEIKAIDAEIKAIVAEAVQFAQESPEPDPSELYTDVYVETPVLENAQ
ncbi:MAG: thiamine pyrophosphate-dependent enzyme, partial [Pseudomonadota bacterium]